MNQSNTRNFIILGTIIGGFMLISTSLFILTKAPSQYSPNEQSSCDNELPMLKERILLQNTQTYVVDQVYSNITDIETHYSPLLNDCIYTLREQYFIYKGLNQDPDFTNAQRKIYSMRTDKELFSEITETRFGGPDEGSFRKYMKELEKYTLF